MNATAHALRPDPALSPVLAAQDAAANEASAPHPEEADVPQTLVLALVTVVLAGLLALAFAVSAFGLAALGIAAVAATPVLFGILLLVTAGR